MRRGSFYVDAAGGLLDETCNYPPIREHESMRDAREGLRTGRAVLLLNKPYGVLCQFTDTSGRPTLAGLVDIPDVYPAGRLDADSEGLVVLTGSGPLQARIAHPGAKLAKTYWVQVEGAPGPEALAALVAGLVLRDGPARAIEARAIPDPADLWPRDPPIRVRKAIPTAWLALTLTEGRNRQVRRMTAAVGLPTLRLVRHAVGPWTVEGLAPGQWRVVRVL
jgi:23S rRNA pseudouridine2457 synthase